MYTIQFYHGEMNEQIKKANSDLCNAFVSLRFNWSKHQEKNYTLVSVASNATGFTKRWAINSADLISMELSTTKGGNNGILIGGRDGCYEAELVKANMPAILIEPLFASNPLQAILIKNKVIQQRISMILVKSILNFFPNGGKIALSFRSSGFNNDIPQTVSEDYLKAEHYADNVLKHAAFLLQAHGKLARPSIAKEIA